MNTDPDDRPGYVTLDINTTDTVTTAVHGTGTPAFLVV